MKNSEVLEMVEVVERIVATRHIPSDQVRVVRKFAELGCEKGTVYQLLEVAAIHLQTLMARDDSTTSVASPIVEESLVISQPNEGVTVQDVPGDGVFV